MVQGWGQVGTKTWSVLNRGYVWLNGVMKSQHFFGNSTLFRKRSHGRQIGVFLILNFNSSCLLNFRAVRTEHVRFAPFRRLMAMARTGSRA